MAVDTHGLEVLKKSGEEVTAGDRSDLYIKVDNLSNMLSGLVYDAGAVTYPSATQEVYTFRTGGIAGTIVATVTLNYVDATKKDLLNWAKS